MVASRTHWVDLHAYIDAQVAVNGVPAKGMTAQVLNTTLPKRTPARIVVGRPAEAARKKRRGRAANRDAATKRRRKRTSAAEAAEVISLL